MQKGHFLFKILVACLTLISSKGFSHDFWLEAHPFYTSPEKSVDISLHVGNEFIGDSLPNISSWYRDFSLYQTAGKSKMKGELGRDPAGYFKPTKTGTYAIGYQSDFTYGEIDPATFLKYLQDEGLQEAIQYREQHQLVNTPGKESYTRHAKALVQSGKGFEIDHSKQRFGYELEIIPLENPYLKKLNEKLRVKVLYKNKPVKNILVQAFSKIKPENIQAFRSNNKGEVSISLNQYGPWLFKAVKILKIENEKENWKSHWASLTFELTH